MNCKNEFYLDFPFECLKVPNEAHPRHRKTASSSVNILDQIMAAIRFSFLDHSLEIFSQCLAMATFVRTAHPVVSCSAIE